MDALALILLILFVGLTWLGPRYFGIAGLLVVQVSVVLAYGAYAIIAMEAGTYQYDGALSAIGLLIQAVLLNCMLLPIGLFALWHHRRTRPGPGFPVVIRDRLDQ